MAFYPEPMAGARKDGAFPGLEGGSAPGGRWRGWVARAVRLLRPLSRSKPVRVVRNYGRNRGPLLAAGLSFHATFAAFAAVWLGLSIGGLVVGSDPALLEAVLEFIDRSVPGLIDMGSGGAIERAVLQEARVIGWTGAVAAAGLFWTALGWLAAARAAIRTIFGLSRTKRNPFLLRLQDAGLALGLGLAVLVSSAITVVGTQALGLFRPYLTSAVVEVAAAAVGLVVTFAFDAAVLVGLFRVLAGIRIPARRLAGGAFAGAVALTGLKALGGQLLVGAARNPLLASFAVIVGLMIWFNLVSQVVLMAASWVAVGARDDGVQLGEAAPSGRPAPYLETSSRAERRARRSR